MNDELASGMTKEGRELLTWRYERAQLNARIEQLENENMELRERNDGGIVALVSAVLGIMAGIFLAGSLLA